MCKQHALREQDAGRELNRASWKGLKYLCGHRSSCVVWDLPLYHFSAQDRLFSGRVPLWRVCRMVADDTTGWVAEEEGHAQEPALMTDLRVFKRGTKAVLKAGHPALKHLAGLRWAWKECQLPSVVETITLREPNKLDFRKEMLVKTDHDQHHAFQSSWWNMS